MRGLRVKALEGAGQRETELFLNHLFGYGEWERANSVLEFDQLFDDIRRDDVGPRAEELTELDKCGAEFVQHLPDMTTSLRRRLRSTLTSLRGQSEKTASLEEIAEAMADHHSGDLPHAPQVTQPGDQVRASHPQSRQRPLPPGAGTSDPGATLDCP